MRDSNLQIVLQSNGFGIIGVSRNPKKFGNTLFREMKKKGLKVYPIHPEAEELENEKCYRTISEVKDKIEGIVLNVPPEKSLIAVKEAEEAGIKNIWLQQGSSDQTVINYCKEKKLNYVSNSCLLMYLEPVESFNKFHRFIWKLLGKYKKYT